MPSMSEMLFVAILALILIGPKQLPEVARTVGRLLNEFRRASDGILDELKRPQQAGQNIVKDLTKEITKEIAGDGSKKPNT